MEQELKAIEQAYELIVNFLITYSFQLLGAAIILIAGFIVGSWVSRVLLRIQEKRNVDVTLRQFIASTARLIVIGLFVVIALSKLGISMTPLIAAIGGLAVGASFAIQGPVSNYGAGFVIILTRMFKVGDTITVQGQAGLVKDITLAQTELEAEDGELIIIPNKHIVGEIHRNSFAYRIVEGRVAIDGRADPLDAVSEIEQTLQSISELPNEPKQVVGIEAFEIGATVIGYRFWVPTSRYFSLLYRVNNEIYQRLSNAGIPLAISQQEILLKR
ncbi:MAG: mechanosensitive ion channel family protein [Pseudomonadota bacterium]